jgi:hypothetical protein
MAEIIKITKDELINIYNIMVQHNRTEGYMDFVGDKLCFFDDDPYLEYVHACPVTIQKVKSWINNYDN